MAQAVAQPPATAPAPGITPEYSATLPPMWTPLVGEPATPLLTRDERVFMREAMASNRFWIEASKLALQKAQRPYVRELAQSALGHHLQAQESLSRLARARGLTPPMLHNDQRKILNRLAKSGGRGFDGEYLDKVAIKDHRDEIWLYEKASRDAKDPELQAWIETNLPALRTHLVLAEDAVRRTEGKPARVRKV